MVESLTFSLLDLQREETKPLVRMAAKMVLGERATLEAVVARWQSELDDDGDENFALESDD